MGAAVQTALLWMCNLVLRGGVGRLPLPSPAQGRHGQASSLHVVVSREVGWAPHHGRLLQPLNLTSHSVQCNSSYPKLSAGYPRVEKYIMKILQLCCQYGGLKANSSPPCKGLKTIRSDFMQKGDSGYVVQPSGCRPLCRHSRCPHSPLLPCITGCLQIYSARRTSCTPPIPKEVFRNSSQCRISGYSAL